MLTLLLYTSKDPRKYLTSSSRNPTPLKRTGLYTAPELTRFNCYAHKIISVETHHFGGCTTRGKMTTESQPCYQFTVFYTPNYTTYSRNSFRPSRPNLTVTEYDPIRDQSYCINEQYTVTKPVVTQTTNEKTYSSISDPKLKADLTTDTDSSTADSLIRKAKYIQSVSTNYNRMNGDIQVSSDTRIFTHQNVLLRLIKNSDNKITVKKSNVKTTANVINSKYIEKEYKSTDLSSDIITIIYSILAENAADQINNAIQFIKS